MGWSISGFWLNNKLAFNFSSDGFVCGEWEWAFSPTCCSQEHFGSLTATHSHSKSNNSAPSNQSPQSFHYKWLQVESVCLIIWGLLYNGVQAPWHVKSILGQLQTVRERTSPLVVLWALWLMWIQRAHCTHNLQKLSPIRPALTVTILHVYYCMCTLRSWKVQVKNISYITGRSFVQIPQPYMARSPRKQKWPYASDCCVLYTLSLCLVN